VLNAIGLEAEEGRCLVRWYQPVSFINYYWSENFLVIFRNGFWGFIFWYL